MALNLRLLLLAAVALPGVALAQATAIMPDVGAARGLGTTAVQAGNVVTIDGGTLAGANLFHSFSQFSLGAGDTAQWVRAGGGATGVSNVISRVTGGQVSQIAGKLDSTALPNASFFFINPAGVVFSAGAQVNVPGAAYFSTAGELRFAGGAKFAVAMPNGSTLSVAAPESFGFLGGQGNITLDGAGTGFANPLTSLSLTAANVGVTGSQIGLRGLDLIGVGNGAAAVSLADPLAVARTGAVSVSGSQLTVLPAAGVAGPVRIGAGAVTFNAGNLTSFTSDAARGGDILVSARTINAASSLISTLATGAGAGGRVAFTASDAINLTNATLGSNGTASGIGGDISVTAKTLSLDTSYIVANAIGVGKGGSISVTAPRMNLAAAIVYTTAAGSGSPGDVVLQGDRIDINGGSFGSAPSFSAGAGSLTINATTSLNVLGGFFSAVAYGDFTSGTISISAPTMTFDSAFFDVESLGAGAVGAIDIQGKSIVFDNSSRISAVSHGDSKGKTGLVHIKATSDLLFNVSYIDSTAYDRTNGGTVLIEGGRLTFDGSEVGADTQGDGKGGQVNVSADVLHLTNSHLTSVSGGGASGDAGDVLLQATSQITLDTESIVSSETDSLQGNAGAVTVKGGKLVLDDQSVITSSATGGFGKAGRVTVNVDSLSLTDSTISSDALSLGDGGDVIVNVTGDLQLIGNSRGFTAISSNAESRGNAGSVTITAKTMTIRDQAHVASEAGEGAQGNAGRISITTGTLKLLNGGYVQSDSLSDGHAGDVTVKADSLTIDGSGDDNASTFISSDSGAGGDAGRVIIDAGALSLIHAGFISSDSFTSGNAGDISITAKTMVVQDGAGVVSQAFPGSFGRAGKITIAADSLAMSQGTLISTSTFGVGDAGEIGITAKTLSVDFSRIGSSAETGARGASGKLKITAGALSVVNNGIIETVSNNTLTAGTISIAADSLLVDGKGSQISSENQAGNTARGNRRNQSGAAGAISLAANAVTISEGGVVSTNSFAGAAGEIKIAMPELTVLRLEGVKAPGAIQTSSGAGTGGKITISAPLAIVSNGGSILALGERRGANVVIESRYLINSSDRANVVAVDGEFKLVAGVYDVSAGTVNRDLSVLDASKVLRGQCPVARSTGQVSQLITRQVGPYVREPAFEPSPLRVSPAPGVVGACM